LCSGGSPAAAVHDVVETGLEEAEEVVAGLALHLRRHLIVMSELALEDAVVTSRHLLCAQLNAVLGSLLSALAVLARGIGSARDRALVCVASLALEEQLLSLAAAQLADGICISCHCCVTS